MKHPPHCLYCRAPLPAFEGASQRCPECGEVALRVDQKIFRTLAPGPRRIEAALKAGIVVIVGLVMWVMFRDKGMHSGARAGYGIGFPLVLGYLLWETAERLTRKRGELRVGLVWALIPVTLFATICGFVLLFAGMNSYVIVLGALVSIVWLFYRDRLSKSSVGARRYPEFKQRP